MDAADTTYVRPSGLRERKKYQLRQALKAYAIELFIQQGYEATTIEQIAEKAKISPRTFFRYFATKEELLFDDDYDKQLILSFQSQPQSFSIVQALQHSLRDTFGALTPEQQAYESKRHAIISATPELQARNSHELVRNIELLSQLVAERTHRSTEDRWVQTFAGALVGVLITARLYAQSHGLPPLSQMEKSLEMFDSITVQEEQSI